MKMRFKSALITVCSAVLLLTVLLASSKFNGINQIVNKTEDDPVIGQSHDIGLRIDSNGVAQNGEGPLKARLVKVTGKSASLVRFEKIGAFSTNGTENAALMTWLLEQAGCTNDEIASYGNEMLNSIAQGTMIMIRRSILASTDRGLTTVLTCTEMSSQALMVTYSCHAKDKAELLDDARIGIQAAGYAVDPSSLDVRLSYHHMRLNGRSIDMSKEYDIDSEGFDVDSDGMNAVSIGKCGLGGRDSMGLLALNVILYPASSDDGEIECSISRRRYGVSIGIEPPVNVTLGLVESYEEHTDHLSMACD